MEHVQVVVAAVGLLVPAHRAFQCVHRVAAAFDRVGLGPDIEYHGATVGGHVVAAQPLQPPGDQREQVAGFRMRIDEACPVAAVRQLAAAIGIAAGQQHRKTRALGTQGDAVARLHVGPVGEKRDVAEALGLALGQQKAGLARAGQVQTFQRGVDCRVQAHAGFQHAAVACAVHFEHVLGVAVGAGGQGLAIQHDRQQFEVFAIQPQRQRLRGIAAQQQPRGQFGGVDAEVEIQLDRLDPPGGRAIVTEAYQRGGLLSKCVHADNVGWGPVRLTCSL